MRFIIALLAVIGLLASPAAAAAAQATCHSHGGEMMMHQAMADMPGMAMADGHKPDPCCDPGKDQVHKHSDAECAQACAAMCGVLAALPSAPVAFLAPPERGPPPLTRLASLKPHEPSRLDRPPRLIA